MAADLCWLNYAEPRSVRNWDGGGGEGGEGGGKGEEEVVECGPVAASCCRCVGGLLRESWRIPENLGES